jgi:hypothetical protein
MVQAGHAALESGLFLSPEGPPEEPDNLVICSTPDEASLLAEAAQHPPGSIRLIREPDLQNRATAMATTALSGRDRKPFRRWRLWNRGALGEYLELTEQLIEERAVNPDGPISEHERWLQEILTDIWCRLTDKETIIAKDRWDQYLISHGELAYSHGGAPTSPAAR